MPTIQQIAQDFSRCFEGAVRDNGTKYRRVTVTSKENPALLTLIVEAHSDMLPDDWRYAFIEQALNAIAENGEDAQLEPAIYTHELTDWLNSRADRCGYCDEYIGSIDPTVWDPYNRPKKATMFDVLQAGMAQEQQEVLASVLHSLQQLAEEE